MKRCPECRRDYYDDTLAFCLDDGARLLEGPASETSTVMLPGITTGSRQGSDPGSYHSMFTPPKLTQVTFSEAIEEYPAWSPDSSQLLFCREESGLRSIFV